MLEPAFRNMAFNEHNEIRLFSPDNFYQGMIGAFTAGLLEGGPAVARNISNTQIGHGVNQAHKADELIGRALMLDTRMEAFRLASKLVDGSVHKNNYNVGELLRTYVESDGDTAFMSMPNTEGIANTQEAVRTTLKQEKTETPDAGMASGVAAMTSSQIGQSIQEGIHRNAAINPEGMQKTVSDGMSALITIETRIRAESSNINHPGIGIDSIHYEYMGYLLGEMELDTTAWSMAEAIKTVVRTQTLTEAEMSLLTGVLAEIVADSELAKAYVLTALDGQVENGYNKKHGVKLARRPISKRQQYMGRTPSKTSQTGNAVITRMESEGKIIDSESRTLFQASDESWYPIDEADMAHIVDAVTWWNEIGRKYGARSKEVLQFMHDPYNYYLEHYSINRSEGAKLKKTYLPPLKEK